MVHRIPTLRNPVQITIRRQNTATTRYDEDAREPIQRVNTITIQLPGQPNQLASGAGDNIVEFTNVGVNEKSEAYILFRRWDLDNHPDGAVALRQGDNIVQIGHLPVSVYIQRLQWMAHYGQGAELVRAWYEDRKPSRIDEGS